MRAEVSLRCRFDVFEFSFDFSHGEEFPELKYIYLQREF
jgi:hypothetical protein